MKDILMIELKGNNFAKAIRNKCLECCCDNAAEVRRCTVVRCPLFPYRFGCSPKVAMRRYTDSIKIISTP